MDKIKTKAKRGRKKDERESLDMNELFLVMDRCDGGELFDRIKEQPDATYSEVDAAGVLRQICEGLAYMHSHKIAHCDLKPGQCRNIRQTNAQQTDLFCLRVITTSANAFN